jgi:hypothetical protein
MGAIMRVLIALFLLATAAFAETVFLRDMEDLPLAPSFTEIGPRAVAFATPEGRLGVAVATGEGEEAAIIGFYAASLPQLGWSAGEKPNSFVRGRDRLTLSFARASDGALEVTYTLLSRPASQAVD